MFCIGFYPRNAINLACNIALSKKYYTFSIFMLNHLFSVVYGKYSQTSEADFREYFEEFGLKKLILWILAEKIYNWVKNEPICL